MLDVLLLTGDEAAKEDVLKRIRSVALVHIAAYGNIESREISLPLNLERTSKVPRKKQKTKQNKDYVKMCDRRLRARLFVLSCCHSAQGKVTAKGVVGKSRVFLGAGARLALVLLWAIDDEATLKFMRSFSKRFSHGCSASVAVHRTVKFLRESEILV